MGRLASSLRAPVTVCQSAKRRGRDVSLRLTVAALITCMLGALPVHAELLSKGSTGREERVQALRDIPFDQLTPAARQKVAEVVEKPSLFRRMPSNVINCDPQIYRFLIRYPEVVVNIWQLMGITKVTTDRVGPYSLNAQDGVGTVTNIELIYGDQDTHLMYCEGNYDGPLFRRPLTGRCVLLLKSGYSQDAEQHWQIANRMDVFLQIDNMAVEVVTRTLHPLLGKSADINFVQSTEFLERISRTSEENGTGMARLAQRLDNVKPEIRDQFAQLTQLAYENSPNRTTTKVAKNTAPEIVDPSQNK